MSGFERSTLRWTRASFFIVLATAAFIALQWNEMRTGGADTHDLAAAAKTQAEKMRSMSDAAEKIRQAAENMVIQDQRIADNAQKALDASNKQSKAVLDASAATFRLDQRAWVGAEDITSTPVVPEVDKVWDVAISLKNSGKTPAKNILMWNNEGVLKMLPDVNADCAEAIKQQASKTMLPPNGSSKVILHVANGIKVPSDWEKEISDNGVLYVHGCILYDDVFLLAHWMTYCGSFDLNHKGSGFTSCLKYNDTGDGKPPK